MWKFRKKPVVIEAVLASTIAFHWRRESLGLLPPWVGAGIRLQLLRPADDGTMTVRTLEGEVVAQPSDWIVRGVAGELYPCRADIFERTYESEPEVS